MTTLQKAVVGALLVIGAVAIWGAYFYPKAVQIAGSPVGASFSTQKFAAVNVSFATATSTAILNTDSSDRWITNLQWQCNGIGTSKLPYTGAALTGTGETLQGATSTSATASTTNSFLAFNTYIATTTVNGDAQMSSSTLVLGGSFGSNQWTAGSYLNIYTIATNTAQCTIGVNYIGS